MAAMQARRTKEMLSANTGAPFIVEELLAVSLDKTGQTAKFANHRWLLYRPGELRRC